MDTLFNLLTTTDTNNVALAYQLRHQFSKEEWWKTLDKIAQEGLQDCSSTTRNETLNQLYGIGYHSRFWFIYTTEDNRLFLCYNCGKIYYQNSSVVELHKKTLTIKHRGDNQLKKLFERLKRIVNDIEKSNRI